jgi:hypothetical protein
MLHDCFKVFVNTISTIFIEIKIVKYYLIIFKK